MTLKKSIGVTAVSAVCEDCGKTFDNHKNGQALVAKHAKDKKHRVGGEVVIMFLYDGRDN